LFERKLSEKLIEKKEVNLNIKKEYLDWDNIEDLVKKTASKIKENNNKYDIIIGIKNGGIIPAKLISRELDINDIDFVSIKLDQFYISSNFPTNKRYLLIDEIYDTGKTFLTVTKFFNKFEYDYACLISRYKIIDNKKIIFGQILNHNKWIVFPWENG
jgi:hypoxanthine phosphoribosyltransferase